MFKFLDVLILSYILQIILILQIPRKFWLIPEGQSSETDEDYIKLEEEYQPYQNAILEIQKLKLIRNPREKMNSLLMMHSLVKSSIVDFHKGKEETLAMDDELPLLILMIAKSNYQNLIADLNLIDDFVESDVITFEAE